MCVNIIKLSQVGPQKLYLLEGVRTELLDLRAYDLPMYGSDGKDAGDAPELRERIREADAVILGSPIYRRSRPSASGSSGNRRFP